MNMTEQEMQQAQLRLECLKLASDLAIKLVETNSSALNDYNVIDAAISYYSYIIGKQ